MCGDGTKDPAEDCDGADLGGQTCASLCGTGNLACNPDCTFDTSNCVDSVCDDGQIGPCEQCDGADLDGYTCQQLGYDGGTLTCKAGTCTFDTTLCSMGGTSSTTGASTSTTGVPPCSDWTDSATCFQNGCNWDFQTDTCG